MKAHRARKRFGQNFLHDETVIDRIVDAIDPGPGQHLVEIGPGQAALTSRIATRECRLSVIEIDRDLVARLQDNPALSRVEIIEADALDIDLSALAGSERIRLLGNLPYNVSTPLIFHALEHMSVIDDMHFMLQKEVVDRMAAGPGSKAYGRLSVMLQYHCEVQPLFVVRPGSFNPVPKVQSAVVRLVPRQAIAVRAKDPGAFARVVTAAFGQRRKTLSNALKTLVDAGTITDAGTDPGNRAEQVSVEQFVHIANALEESR